MAYAVNADVINEFKALVTSGGAAITTTKIDEWITQAEGLINGMISNKYVTPVTGTESVKILKMITIWLVADRIKEILKVKNVNEDVDQGVKDGSLYKRALDMLKDISKGTLPLTDATLLSSQDGLRSYAADVGLEYTFKRNTDQW